MLMDWFKIKKFNKAIQENLDLLVKFAYARCCDRTLAEDLVQDTCLKAYKAYILKNDEIIKPKEWLFRILINTHISYLRKKQLQTVNDFDFNNCDVEINDEISLDYDKEILEEDISFALQKLTADQRGVIYLVDIKEYSFKEASKLLGIPFGTLTSRLHRGRQKLKAILIELGYSKDYIKAGSSYGL